MFPLKLICGFFLRLVFVYALLAYPWSFLTDTYAAAYRSIGNGALGSFGTDGTVRFEPLSGGAGMLDTEIVLKNRRTRAVSRTEHSARLTGYLPTVEVIALIVATPIPWSRRCKALVWGLVWINVFVAARTALVPLYGFCNDTPCALFWPSPFWMDVLTSTFNIGVKWSSLTFVAPVFVWIAVTLRLKDLHRWRG